MGEHPVEAGFPQSGFNDVRRCTDIGNDPQLMRSGKLVEEPHMLRWAAAELVQREDPFQDPDFIQGRASVEGKGFSQGRKIVEVGRIVVGGLEGLTGCPHDGHDIGAIELPPANGQISPMEILLRAESVVAEHEGPIHVEEDDIETIQEPHYGLRSDVPAGLASPSASIQE